VRGRVGVRLTEVVRETEEKVESEKGWRMSLGMGGWIEKGREGGRKGGRKGGNEKRAV
jgi:hypothetical protein